MLIDNKKTREISWNDFELSGNKENLINQGWDSFEPYGNKPNLIQNGWDDFQAFGSGENILLNWDFSGSMSVWNNFPKTKNNTVIVGQQWDFRQRVSNVEDGRYMLRIKARKHSEIPSDKLEVNIYDSDLNVTEIIDLGSVSSNKYNVFEKDLNIQDFRQITILSRPTNSQIEIDWVQLTPYDNQHLILEKTSLENGLTHIKTWGGNNVVKIFTPQANLQKLTTDSIYIKNLNNEPMSIVKNNPYMREYIEDEKYVTLTGVGVAGRNNNMQILANGKEGNLNFIASDPQIVEGDEANMAYSIEELDNDLYRIRTWGGSADMKFTSPNFRQLGETGTDMTISLYVENNSDSMIRFSNNLAIGGVPYPDGVEYMITVPREYKGFAYLKGELVGRDVELDVGSDGNIDMIVSQPEIIEGHDLNAMLLIEDLDDGRKHVQVHNVNKNTKLVYTGGGVIKGEPYTLETEIENDGRIFNLSANMLDDKIEVQKGMNDIRKSGELQDKELKIEIGVD